MLVFQAQLIDERQSILKHLIALIEVRTNPRPSRTGAYLIILSS
jgi:hypothetical protein